MTCEEFQMMLADALGDELSDSDRPAFKAHIATCSRCRADYESMHGAVQSLHVLPEPQPLIVRREHDRLILRVQPESALRLARRGHSEEVVGSVGDGPSRTSVAWFSHGLLRYAASVLVAFSAGYALHSMLSPRGDASGRSASRVVDAVPNGDSLQSAIAGAHLRNPARSDLAKCLIAMYDPRR